MTHERDVVDLFHEGARAPLREQIVPECGVEEDECVFSISCDWRRSTP